MGSEAGADVVGLHLHDNVVACIEYTADINIFMTRAAEVKSWMFSLFLWAHLDLVAVETLPVFSFSFFKHCISVKSITTRE